MNQQLEKSLEDRESRLEERPLITLRLRITLGFVIFALFITGITVACMLMLSHLQTRMSLLEEVDECAYQIQEARRYEKNFFLYGTTPYDALEHIYRAHRLLEENIADITAVVGVKAARTWLEDLTRYEQLLDQLARPKSETEQGEAAQREAELQLRQYGATILDHASRMITEEKKSMNSLIRTYIMGAGFSLVFLVLLMVVVAYQLTHQVMRPIGRFVHYVERIAGGDFSHIHPARAYKDEFSTLAVAINRMLDELKRRQDQLLQAAKMAAVGTLTSGVAHELNNPLNNISLTVETLLDDYEEADDNRKKMLLNDIFTQVQRAGATVRNLLDFTRKDKPVFTRVPILEVLETTLKLTSNELTLARVEVSMNLDPDLPDVSGNPRNLQQVFLNLFLNAAQAMPDGGDIRIGAKLEDGLIRVSVTDTGEGIAEEDLPKIFEPFFTTKDTGEGSGLGLPVSYGIIEKHGGRIEVESRKGEGTTFYIYLPVHVKSD